MDGRRGAGEVVDLIDFQQDGLDDVVPDQLEVGPAGEPVGTLSVPVNSAGPRSARGLLQASHLSSKCATFSFVPVKKLSRQMTWSPRSTSAVQRWEPTNPATASGIAGACKSKATCTADTPIERRILHRGTSTGGTHLRPPRRQPACAQTAASS